MEKFCENCNAPLSNDDLFCTKCGAKVKPSSVSAKAPSASGEILLGEKEVLHNGPKTTPTGPFKFISEEIKRFFQNIKASLKNRRKIVLAIVLAVIWIILIILAQVGVNDPFTGILSFITFARGGLSNSPLNIFGGLVGKGIIAYFFSIIIFPLLKKQNPFKPFLSGIKGMFSVFKDPKNNMASILAGTSIALIVGNFLTGDASPAGSMAFISCGLLSIRSVVSSNGIIQRFISSFSRKKKVSGASFSTGLATGFAISIPLSFIPLAQIGYLAGGIAALACVISLIFVGKNKDKAMRTASFFLIMFSCAVYITFPLFAITVNVSGDDHLPYDDTTKYKYFVKLTNDPGSHENGITELEYDYDIQVRFQSNSVFASVDNCNILISGLPAENNVFDQHEFDVDVAPYGDPPNAGRTIQWEIDYSYEASIGSETGLKSLDWAEFVANKMSGTEGEDISQGSFSGYPSLTVAQPLDEYESDRRLSLKQVSSVYVYLEDISLPGGAFILDIDIRASADGTMDYFSELDDFEQRVDVVKNEVIAVFDSAKEDAQSLLTSYGSIKIDSIYTVDLRNQGSTGVIIDTDADTGPGETGVSVPAVIVVGVAGLAAAAAGAGASGEGQDKKRSKYKMYLYKDFGDAIKYNVQAVYVYARMAEITAEGTELERPDLTSQITAFSPDPQTSIGTPAMSGSYVAVSVEAVSASGSEKPETGTVSFKFNGEGGSFQNNVTFRLVGDPFIRFEAQGDNIFMEARMLQGDNGVCEVPFTLNDFMKIPKVSIAPQEGSPFEATLEKLSDFRYKAIIKNLSQKPDKPNAEKETFNVDVSAETENDRADSSFRVAMYPEGLSVSIVKFDKDGHALFGAYAQDEAEQTEKEVLATRFKVELAVQSQDEEAHYTAELVDPSKVEMEIAKLKGTDNRTENLTKVFRYEIEKTDIAGTYKFQPEKQIPEGDSKLYLLLPLSCSYNGQAYDLDLPVRLIGEPFNEMKAKQEELDLLLKRIKRYMPAEDWPDVIRHINENYDKLSSKEIRLLNKSIYKVTARKLLDEAQEQIDFADTLDWVVWGLEWVKWVGDQAFSYLAFVYTGPLGEAILSPAKEIMVGLISEDIWYREGISDPADKLRNVNSNLMAMLENSLMTQIDSKTSLKKAGAILASFLVIKTINHYYNDLGPDGKPIGFYDALLAGFGDLTANTMKFIVSEKFNDLANSPQAKEYFNKYASAWIRKFLDANARGWQQQGSDVVSKYIQELCGLGAAKAYSKASQTGIDTKDGLVMTFNLWDDPKNKNNSVIVSLDLIRIKDALFDYIFKDMFSVIPFAQSVIEPPEDPVFIDNKK